MDAAEPDLDDPRVFQAVQEYMAALETGRKPDRDAFVARYPEIAPALAECLAGLDLVHTAGPKLRDPAPPPGGGSEPPAALGDFRIVRELGRGGMGVVYEAVQLSLGRRVALKVLPFAAALDSRQLQRFKTEAQAAAHLHHPHIVPVYAVGTDRGVHYYAMQLIEGQNLAAVVDDLRRDPAAAPGRPESAPTGNFPTPRPETRTAFSSQFTTMRSQRAGDFYRSVARLVAQAADALEYAHENGVVHRDIKPANLLVDGNGNLWVTDFGLAQVHADTSLTQTGDLLGTLRYMSPEQAGGPRGLIDHRTDVYSLGATLYELLTLRPIFDGADRRALLHQIMNEEPRAPRATDRAIPADLETIVLKAIGKHPADRYPTARDLADDLNRFLRHEPIRARRSTTVQRVRKWLRRHPSVPVAATVLLVLLTAASLVSAFLIRGEQEKTRLAYQEERRRAREADERLRLARRSVDNLIQTAETELGDHPHHQGLRKKLLESALAYYQEFIEHGGEDPELQADLTATRQRVRQILDDLAELEGAGHLFLLNDSEVLADLQVSEEQRAALQELNRHLGEQRAEVFANFRRMTAEERRTRHLELARANEAGATAILLPDQAARLRQISLQTRGLGAFQDPAVARALGLTADQQARIRGIEADIFLPHPHDRGRPGGPPFVMPKKGPDDFWRGVVEKALAVLTDEQKQGWQDMTGKPFVRKKPPFRGGGPPGDRFGPPPGPRGDGRGGP